MSRRTIEDVARAAGVSVATVDRVLNRRPGVRPVTVERVEAAVRELDYQPDRVAARLARSRDYRLVFVLPTGVNSFMQALQEAVHETAAWFAGERVDISLRLVDVFDPAALAHALQELPDSLDGVAVVALDHPLVRLAIDGLVERGVRVVTLVSDVPASRRARHVGVDNFAAGRTAASLLGRFLGGRQGCVGMIAGSLGLRDHAERRSGFEQVLAREFSFLEVLEVREGRDDYRRVEELVRDLLAQRPDLIGLYNVGAGNRGAVRALEAAGRAQDVVFIAHELTPHSRRALVEGTIDAVINQEAGHEVRSAARVLVALLDDSPIMPSQERIRIDIFLRDNLP